MKPLHYTLLGTGSSHGIPSIGCNCSVCTSSEPKNSRRRCSLYVSYDNTHLVIDTPPDFREQVLSYGVSQIDALFITHAHADHIMGFDDVRRFSHHHTTGLPVTATPKPSYKCAPNLIMFSNQATLPIPFPKFNLYPSKSSSKLAAHHHSLPVPHGTMATYGYRVETSHHALAISPTAKLFQCNPAPP